MNQHLQKILDFFNQDNYLSPEEKTVMLKAVKDTDTAFVISEFKLDRTEKVKRTTAILLEETIEELELKRKARNKCCLTKIITGFKSRTGSIGTIRKNGKPWRTHRRHCS